MNIQDPVRYKENIHKNEEIANVGVKKTVNVIRHFATKYLNEFEA
jgi:hypothetical protein